MSVGYGHAEHIRHLREQGYTIAEIARRLNLAPSTVWCYTRGKYGRRERRTYDYAELRSLYIKCGSISQVAHHAGCAYDTVKAAVQDLLDDSPSDAPAEEYHPEFKPWAGGDVWIEDRSISTRRQASAAEQVEVKRLTRAAAIDRYLDGDREAVSKWLNERGR